MAIKDHRHHHRGNTIRSGEEGRKMAARNQLRVAERAAHLVRLARSHAKRFAVRKARRNHTLVTVWSLVHPVFR